MDTLTVFPDGPIPGSGVISQKFLELDIHTFHEACQYAHQLHMDTIRTRMTC